MRSDDQDSQREQQLATEGEGPGAEIAAPAVEEPRFLFFRCGGADCAAPLAALREVLPQCPPSLPLPHSLDWLMGVFALRAELVGLADPEPLLFESVAERSSAPKAHRAALVVGKGARMLAWAVESIGATAPLGGPDASDAEPVDTQAPQDDTTAHPRAAQATVVAHYATGAIALADGRRYTVIDVDALLADMLRALEERPANR